VSKMTVTCRSCDFVFGAWRPRCPTCGTEVPASVRQEMLAPRQASKEDTPKQPRREREKRPDDCIQCHHRGAKERCTHCAEPIHKACRGLHEANCVKFQVERQEAINALSNPAALAKHIEALLKGGNK
jgi:hypothetical protein